MTPFGPSNARSASKQWLVIAIASLIVAGLQSLMLVVGRMPLISSVFTDPLFFRRALVVHVNLALLVWFYAFLIALYFLLPAERQPSFASKRSAIVASIGVMTFVAAAGVPGAKPILSNYIPVVDHPIFLVGLCMFGVGVLLAALDARLLPSAHGLSFYPLPDSAAIGVRAGVLALVLAALTFLASAMTIPSGLPENSYYELVLWGGGHVLQFANVAGMTAVWLTLLQEALGRPAVSYRIASGLYVVLVAPLLAAPLLGLSGQRSHEAFTTLMRWGIFPVVVTFIVLCMRSILQATRERRDGRNLWLDARVLAFCASAFLSLVGFTLGALIRGSNTLIPAHYHASIGAVTVAYMAFSYRLLERLGMPLPTGRIRKLAAFQPAAFGIGQFVFAIGFALAGAHGMARKAYGAEQHIRTLSETAGLLIMGVGGLLAVIAGVAFLVMTSRAWLEGHKHKPQSEGDPRWTIESIRSRS